MKFSIILNPAGKGGRAVKKWRLIEKMLKEKGVDYKLYRSSCRDGIYRLCHKLTNTGEDVNLIIIGGDGSMNQAVNGICDFEHTRLGLIPAGTGNDYIRSFDIPQKLEDYVDMLFEGKERHTADVGEVKFCNVDGEDIVRRFNISCELGFGAEVCYRVDHSALKPVLKNGSLVFLCEVLRSVKGLKPFTINVDAGGRKAEYKKALSSMVMNTPFEGGGMKFCPDARFDDGEFDIATGNLSKLRFMSIVPLSYIGKTTKIKGIHMERAPYAILESDIPQYAHADGECVGQTTRIEVKQYEHKLHLLM